MSDEPVKATKVTATESSNPPKGAPDGGTWGILKYVGEKTRCLAVIGFLLCCIPGCCIVLACCPQDEKDAYVVKGKVSTTL